MPEVGTGTEGLTPHVESLPCQIELPDGCATAPLVAARIIDDGDDRRRAARIPCRVTAAIHCQQTLPGIWRAEQWIRVMLRNVSRFGAGFWHSEQLYPREECLLVLPGGILRNFQVKRCQRLGAKCYEIGGEFTDEDRGMDLERILR